MWRPSKFTLVIRKVRKPFLHCWSCVYLHGQYGHHISAVVWGKQDVPSILYQNSLKLLFNFGMPTFQISFQSENLLLCCQQLWTMSLFTVYIRILEGFFFRTQFRSEKHFGGRIAMSAFMWEFWGTYNTRTEMRFPSANKNRKAGVAELEMLLEIRGKKCFMALFNIHWYSCVGYQFWWIFSMACRTTIQAPAMLITWPLRGLLLLACTLPNEL